MNDNPLNGAQAPRDQGHGAGDGRRRIDLSFIRSGDDVELLVANVPEDVVIRHAYWDYDAERISAMFNRDVTDGERETFLADSITRVQGWNSSGGMDALRDKRRIAELERQVAQLSRK